MAMGYTREIEFKRLKMVLFSKESVQRLREAIDIVDLISRYVDLKKAGAAYKGLCPFHDERTPSFTVQAASRHYHCFGCGAHGDGLSFLMQHENLDFKQSLEFLAERYGVTLEVAEGSREQKGIPKVRLRQVMEAAAHFYHTALLHSKEASGAREYLSSRRFSSSFLRAFGLGFAPEKGTILSSFLLEQGFSRKEMMEVGLIGKKGGDFFTDRILFPIHDAIGNIIGFSGRKWREKTFGGKYINTSETPLFKKSQVLFGLYRSKKRLIRERFACLVEGQLDALRLIEAGFDFTVATLGTAFGMSHVDQLRAFGVEEVYLSFDQDEAGHESAEKAGHMLMKRGIGVRVVSFDGAKDPDELLSNQGKSAFYSALATALPYVEYVVNRSKQRYDWGLPQNKDRQVRKIAERIKEWDSSILVHESLRQLASLVQVPEKLLNISERPVLTSLPSPSLPISVAGDATMMLELDIVHYLVHGFDNKELVECLSKNISENDFISDQVRKLFSKGMKQIEQGERVDFVSLASELDTEDGEKIFQLLVSRKQKAEDALQKLKELIYKVRERNWLQKREAIRLKMEETHVDEQELMTLAKKFDDLMKSPPEKVF
jgi:DNA primase